MIDTEKTTRKFHVILACTLSCGIGKDGKIPWNIPDDMRHFREITQKTKDPNKRNMVIMGRKTWESLPKKPLNGRKNVIITSMYKKELDERCTRIDYNYVSSFEDALVQAENDTDIESIYVIGGAQLYNEAMKHPNCNILYITMINHDFDCDTFFDRKVLNRFQLQHLGDVHTYNGIEYAFSTAFNNLNFRFGN